MAKSGAVQFGRFLRNWQQKGDKNNGRQLSTKPTKPGRKKQTFHSLGQLNKYYSQHFPPITELKNDQIQAFKSAISDLLYVAKNFPEIEKPLKGNNFEGEINRARVISEIQFLVGASLSAGGLKSLKSYYKFQYQQLLSSKQEPTKQDIRNIKNKLLAAMNKISNLILPLCDKEHKGLIQERLNILTLAEALI